MSFAYPEAAKLALSDATTMSHEAASWRPAAVAIPFTFAIIGTGDL